MNIIDLLSKYLIDLMLWIYKVLPRILVFYIINIPVIVIFIVFRISRDNLVIFLICNIIFTISLWFYILAIKHKKLKNVVNNIFDETKRYFLEMLLIMLVNSIIIIGISIISLLINYLFKKYNDKTHSAILGIILSSILLLIIKTFSITIVIQDLIIGIRCTV